MRDGSNRNSPVPRRVNITGPGRSAPDRASLTPNAARGGEGLVSHGEYPLPEELASHAPKSRFVPDELRRACREAGEELGREDAREARFRTAAEMVALWHGLDQPSSPANSPRGRPSAPPRRAGARGGRRGLQPPARGPRANIAGWLDCEEVSIARQALQHTEVSLRPADQDGPAREGCGVLETQTLPSYGSVRVSLKAHRRCASS